MNNVNIVNSVRYRKQIMNKGPETVQFPALLFMGQGLPH